MLVDTVTASCYLQSITDIDFVSSCLFCCRSRWPCDLLPLDCWNIGFESQWRYECSSVVFVVCCVGSGLCGEPITTSETSNGCLCLNVCDLKTSKMRRPKPNLGYCATKKSLFYSLPFSLSSFPSLSHSIPLHLFSVSRLSASTPAPGPSHPPIQRVQMTLSPTGKRPKTWSSHQLSGEVKNAWS